MFGGPSARPAAPAAELARHCQRRTARAQFNADMGHFNADMGHFNADMERAIHASLQHQAVSSFSKPPWKGDCARTGLVNLGASCYADVTFQARVAGWLAPRAVQLT